MIYLYGQYMTADDEAEAAGFAARLGLPADRFRMAGTPRWHWVLSPSDQEWAESMGAKPVELVVFQMLVAVRSDQAGLPPPAGVIACGARTRQVSYNPRLRRHSWGRPREHVRQCGWCRVTVVNAPGDRGRWFKTWTWEEPRLPGQEDGSNRYGGKVPPCPGPRVDQ